MKQLSFEVNGQYIKRSDDLVPVAKSRNYFYAHFDFKTPEWTGTKTALFQLGNDRRAAVLDDNDDCLIPWEFFDTDCDTYGKVSVFCGSLVTANEAFVKILKSGYGESDASVPPSPDVYEQITGIMEDTKEIAQSVRDDADGGKFVGPPGPPGPQGNPGIVIPSNGVFAFRVMDDHHLYLIYNSTDRPPAVYIDEETGHLIFGKGGGS